MTSAGPDPTSAGAPTPEPGGPRAQPGSGPRPVWLLPAGFAIAFVGATCGIGGGLFAVPLLHFVFRKPLRLAVGTSLYLVLIVTATSTVTEIAHAESSLRPGLVLLLAAAALLGNQLGYRASQRIPQRALKAVFVVVLAIAAYRLFRGGAALDAATGELVYDAGRIALILAIGFGGGFVAPLLGVGGGLVMVPALVLFLPEIGYLGARAQSMAVGSVNAARSVLFYQREDAIERGVAAWFAGGAFGGSILGVLFVHQPGWASHARVAMGVVLVVVTLRFLVDLRPARPQAAGR